MSRIIFRETYILIIPSFTEVRAHAHPFFHLFLGSRLRNLMVDDVDVSGQAIFVGPDVKHILPEENGCSLFLLFDPTSDDAIGIKNGYLTRKNYAAIEELEIGSFLKELDLHSDEEIGQFADQLLKKLLPERTEHVGGDERMEELRREIRQGNCYHKSVASIAKEHYLSESRLLHLFTETMGISISSVLKR